MRAFNAFNCVGCHMSNGGGGMGPALSNSFFVYGGEPENIYLTIVQGRPNGMPAWGAVLPEDIIWDVVAYVTSISKEPPNKSWGVTVTAGSPDIEQVPAELQSTARPWDHTQKFSNGQKP
jgi:cytochrome c oxidase cbb3-type subunit 3